MRIYAPSDTNSLHIERVSDTAHYQSTLTSMILDTHRHYSDTLGWVDVHSGCCGGCGDTRVNVSLTAAQKLGRSRRRERELWRGRRVASRKSASVLGYPCHLCPPRVLPLSFCPKEIIIVTRRHIRSSTANAGALSLPPRSF
jgi:hypothetical protein